MSQSPAGVRPGPTLRVVRQRPGPAILAEEDLRHAIDRERLLADRNHRRFCLVVFHLRAGIVRLAPNRRVVGLLGEHARLTDDVGWLGRLAIGFLLRETDSEGAQAFGSRVAAKLATSRARVAWEVMGYPESRKCGVSAPA